MHAPRSQSLDHPLCATMLFHPRAQSILFPVKSGQWRWRRAWGLGSSQRIYTRSSFQSWGLTDRLHLLAGHRTGQLLTVHWLVLRIILFTTPCECHSPLPCRIHSSTWTLRLVLPSPQQEQSWQTKPGWCLSPTFSAKAVIQLKYSSNRAEKIPGHTMQSGVCLSWHFKAEGLVAFCPGRPGTYRFCSQNTTTINPLTSHLTNLTEIRFCLCLIWIKWFTVTHRSGVSYEATACWPY